MDLNVNCLWLYLFAIKSYRNLIISIVFYCFSHLWRHNPQNIEIEVLIFCMEPHFAMIHHLWKFHRFSISRTYSKNRGHYVPPLMYGVAQNRPCEVGLNLCALFTLHRGTDGTEGDYIYFRVRHFRVRQYSYFRNPP